MAILLAETVPHPRYTGGAVPAFVFANRAMHEAALPLLDELDQPVSVLRPASDTDDRLVHVVTGEQFAYLKKRFAAAGIEFQLVEALRGRAANGAQVPVDR